MHRATPLNSSFRGYSSGGARSVVDKVDDDKMMQEMNGNFMKGETRDRVESPQNYGFTSVVLPAKKGKDGQIEESAEAFIGFQGGNRSFPVAYVMDDRRHRPYGLKPGENAQYDDIGQMTLMRRNGTYVLSLDSEDESQQQQSGGSGGATPAQQAESGGGKGKVVERMVSIRHVEKKKQERKKNSEQEQGDGQAGGAPAARAETGGQSGGQSKEHKHEGEKVNTEVRLTKNRIEFRVGEKVVGFYDVKDDKWQFNAKDIHNEATNEIKDKAPKILHNG